MLNANLVIIPKSLPQICVGVSLVWKQSRLYGGERSLGHEHKTKITIGLFFLSLEFYYELFCGWNATDPTSTLKIDCWEVNDCMKNVIITKFNYLWVTWAKMRVQKYERYNWTCLNCCFFFNQTCHAYVLFFRTNFWIGSVNFSYFLEFTNKNTNIDRDTLYYRNLSCTNCWRLFVKSNFQHLFGSLILTLHYSLKYPIRIKEIPNYFTIRLIWVCNTFLEILVQVVRFNSIRSTLIRSHFFSDLPVKLRSIVK